MGSEALNRDVVTLSCLPVRVGKDQDLGFVREGADLCRLSTDENCEVELHVEAILLPRILRQAFLKALSIFTRAETPIV